MDGYKIDRTLLSSGDMQAILSGLRSLPDFVTKADFDWAIEEATRRFNYS